MDRSGKYTNIYPTLFFTEIFKYATNGFKISRKSWESTLNSMVSILGANYDVGRGSNLTTVVWGVT
jgi:hypothetical protein